MPGIASLRPRTKSRGLHPAATTPRALRYKSSLYLGTRHDCSNRTLPSPNNTCMTPL